MWKKGRLSSLYLDRHRAYSPGSDNQFARVAKQLHVRLIHANSPQAKGRVQRISTIAQANAFLPHFLKGFNSRFRREARSGRNMHHRPPHARILRDLFAIQNPRTVKRDNTISYQNKTYQILNAWKGTRPRQIQVHQRMDGTIRMLYRRRYLDYQLTEEP